MIFDTIISDYCHPNIVSLISGKNECIQNGYHQSNNIKKQSKRNCYISLLNLYI